MTGTNPDIVQIWIFITQGVLGVLVTLVLFLLNGMRTVLRDQAAQFQRLNDSVLKDYMPRADVLQLYNAQRIDLHTYRDASTEVATRLAVLEKLFEMDHAGLIIRSQSLKDAYRGG